MLVGIDREKTDGGGKRRKRMGRSENGRKINGVQIASINGS